MASVHVDAYFDYMLSRPNEYYQLPQKNPTEASDDESDVVLKLIKRAGSKRQKRKYTRKNTNTSNDDGASHPEGASSTELDDENQFESEDVDDGTDKHRDKRARPSYSDDNEGSEDDRDPWGEMEVDEEEEEEESERPTEQTGGSNQRRKSVQFASNLVSLPHLIEPKNGSNIPTPNPSPTTMPDMSLSSGIVTGNKRVLSHSGATGGAGTQKLRWRISTGPTHAVRSSADESNLTTSPSSSQKESKKKQDTSQIREPREQRQPPMARPPRNITTNVSNEQQIVDVRNFAEMLLPSTLPNNDKDTISMLQKKLVSAVGLLEDFQRKNNLLNDIVRQRDEDVRQRVIRAIKDEVNSVLERFH